MYQTGQGVQLKANQILKLLKPLYDLLDSGDFWGATFSKHLKDLETQNAIGDAAFPLQGATEHLQGVADTVVDDTLQSGDETIMRIAGQTEKRFHAENGSMTMLPSWVKKTEKTSSDGCRLGQISYIDDLSSGAAGDLLHRREPNSCGSLTCDLTFAALFPGRRKPQRRSSTRTTAKQGKVSTR